jgi:hypothetical protein
MFCRSLIRASINCRHLFDVHAYACLFAGGVVYVECCVSTYFLATEQLNIVRENFCILCTDGHIKCRGNPVHAFSPKAEHTSSRSRSRVPTHLLLAMEAPPSSPFLVLLLLFFPSSGLAAPMDFNHEGSFSFAVVSTDSYLVLAVYVSASFLHC